jgi:lipopolysaccharide transport system permease protein
MAMTEKEIKARYKFAVFGFLWIVLNPLLQMLVIGFVFQFFVPVRVENYFLFLFAGLLAWNFFSLSVTKATPSIIFERTLIQKAKFPREAIVLSIVFSNLFHFVISLLLLLVVVAVLTFSSPTNVSLLFVGIRLLLGTLGVVWLTVFTSSLSLFLSAFNVKFRDINFMVQAVMPLWFYATPIVYTLDLLPQWLARWAYLNPMTAIIELFHLAILNQMPLNPKLWLVSVIASVLVAIGGWLTFKHLSKNFDDWI